jgi:hypothetical protein
MSSARLVFVTCSLVCACTSSPNSGGTGGAAGAAGSAGAWCTEERTDLALDAPTPFGFSAGDLFTLVQGTRVATLEWQPAPRGPTGVDATTQVTLFVEPAPVSAQLVDRTQHRPPLFDTYTCGDGVELHTGATLTTADGALDESIADVVWVYDETKPSPRLTALLKLLPGEVHGTLSPVVQDGACLEDVEIWLHLDAEYFGGEVVHIVNIPCSDPGAMGGWTDGTWSCSASSCP